MTALAKRTTSTRTRSFEHNLVAPLELLRAPDGAPRKTRSYAWERLMSVVIRNGFYNSAGGVCPDFTAYPTPASQTLMRSLGLLLKREIDGFSVIFDRKRQTELLGYLRRQRERSAISPGPGENPGAWTRLAFRLATQNPFFVNLSRIPLDTRPAVMNFFLDNRRAHTAQDTVCLTPGERITAAELLPVVPTQVAVPVTPDTAAVEILAISGEIVERTSALGQKRVYLDFSRLPEDRYDVRRIGAGGEAGLAEPVVFTSFDPMPLVFIDLFFSDPTLAGAGIYPVQDLLDPERTTIVPVRYELFFEQRATVWIYDIVSEAAPFTNLSIVDRSTPAIVFSAPEKVVLANGTPAYRLVSEKELDLFERSPYRFELWGASTTDPVERQLVARLPVASPQDVRPGNPSTCTVYVYV